MNYLITTCAWIAVICTVFTERVLAPMFTLLLALLDQTKATKPAAKPTKAIKSEATVEPVVSVAKKPRAKTTVTTEAKPRPARRSRTASKSSARAQGAPAVAPAGFA